MNFICIILFVFFKIHLIENIMLPYGPGMATMDSNTPAYVNTHPLDSDESEKIINLKNYDERDDDYEMEKEKQLLSKKPCAVVVLSSMQNPSMQSLLRRYRYNSRGVLIPSSVKYFIKLPQGRRASPILMPLNDKAFSPLGGFVRYYKEVPPIPHSF